MVVNIDELRKLMNENANGNYNEFARQTGIDVGQLYKVLNREVGAGTVTISKLINYIKQNGLRVEDYIFLG